MKTTNQCLDHQDQFNSSGPVSQDSKALQIQPETTDISTSVLEYKPTPTPKNQLQIDKDYVERFIPYTDIELRHVSDEPDLYVDSAFKSLIDAKPLAVQSNKQQQHPAISADIAETLSASRSNTEKRDLPQSEIGEAQELRVGSNGDLSVKAHKPESDEVRAHKNESSECQELGDESKVLMLVKAHKTESIESQELGDESKEPIFVKACKSESSKDQELGDESKVPNLFKAHKTDRVEGQELGDESKVPISVKTHKTENNRGQELGDESKVPSLVKTHKTVSKKGQELGDDSKVPILVKTHKTESGGGQELGNESQVKPHKTESSEGQELGDESKVPVLLKTHKTESDGGQELRDESKGKPNKTESGEGQELGDESKVPVLVKTHKFEELGNESQVKLHKTESSEGQELGDESKVPVLVKTHKTESDGGQELRDKSKGKLHKTKSGEGQELGDESKVPVLVKTHKFEERGGESKVKLHRTESGEGQKLGDESKVPVLVKTHKTESDGGQELRDESKGKPHKTESGEGQELGDESKVPVLVKTHKFEELGNESQVKPYKTESDGGQELRDESKGKPHKTESGEGQELGDESKVPVLVKTHKFEELGDEIKVKQHKTESGECQELGDESKMPILVKRNKSEELGDESKVPIFVKPHKTDLVKGQELGDESKVPVLVKACKTGSGECQELGDESKIQILAKLHKTEIGGCQELGHESKVPIKIIKACKTESDNGQKPGDASQVPILVKPHKTGTGENQELGCEKELTILAKAQRNESVEGQEQGLGSNGPIFISVQKTGSGKGQELEDGSNGPMLVKAHKTKSVEGQELGDESNGPELVKTHKTESPKGKELGDRCHGPVLVKAHKTESGEGQELRDGSNGSLLVKAEKNEVGEDKYQGDRRNGPILVHANETEEHERNGPFLVETHPTESNDTQELEDSSNLLFFSKSHKAESGDGQEQVHESNIPILVKAQATKSAEGQWLGDISKRPTSWITHKFESDDCQEVGDRTEVPAAVEAYKTETSEGHKLGDKSTGPTSFNILDTKGDGLKTGEKSSTWLTTFNRSNAANDERQGGRTPGPSSVKELKTETAEGQILVAKCTKPASSEAHKTECSGEQNLGKTRTLPTTFKAGKAQNCESQGVKRQNLLSVIAHMSESADSQSLVGKCIRPTSFEAHTAGNGEQQALGYTRTLLTPFNTSKTGPTLANAVNIEKDEDLKLGDRNTGPTSVKSCYVESVEGLGLAGRCDGPTLHGAEVVAIRKDSEPENNCLGRVNKDQTDQSKGLLQIKSCYRRVAVASVKTGVQKRVNIPLSGSERIKFVTQNQTVQAESEGREVNTDMNVLTVNTEKGQKLKKSEIMSHNTCIDYVSKRKTSDVANERECAKSKRQKKSGNKSNPSSYVFDNIYFHKKFRADQCFKGISLLQLPNDTKQAESSSSSCTNIQNEKEETKLRVNKNANDTGPVIYGSIRNQQIKGTSARNPSKGIESTPKRQNVGYQSQAFTEIKCTSDQNNHFVNDPNFKTQEKQNRRAVVPLKRKCQSVPGGFSRNKIPKISSVPVLLEGRQNNTTIIRDGELQYSKLVLNHIKFRKKWKSKYGANGATTDSRLTIERLLHERDMPFFGKHKTKNGQETVDQQSLPRIQGTRHSDGTYQFDLQTVKDVTQSESTSSDTDDNCSNDSRKNDSEGNSNLPLLEIFKDGDDEMIRHQAHSVKSNEIGTNAKRNLKEKSHRNLKVKEHNKVTITTKCSTVNIQELESIASTAHTVSAEGKEKDALETKSVEFSRGNSNIPHLDIFKSEEVEKQCKQGTPDKSNDVNKHTMKMLKKKCEDNLRAKKQTCKPITITTKDRTEKPQELGSIVSGLPTVPSSKNEQESSTTNNKSKHRKSIRKDNLIVNTKNFNTLKKHYQCNLEAKKQKSKKIAITMKNKSEKMKVSKRSASEAGNEGTISAPYFRNNTESASPRHTALQKEFAFSEETLSCRSDWPGGKIVVKIGSVDTDTNNNVLFGESTRNSFCATNSLFNLPDTQRYVNIQVLDDTTDFIIEQPCNAQNTLGHVSTHSNDSTADEINTYQFGTHGSNLDIPAVIKAEVEECSAVDKFATQHIDDPEATLLYGFDGPGGKMFDCNETHELFPEPGHGKGSETNDFYNINNVIKMEVDNEYTENTVSNETSGFDIEKETICTDDTSVDSFVAQNVDDPEATLLYGFDGPGGMMLDGNETHELYPEPGHVKGSKTNDFYNINNVIKMEVDNEYTENTVSNETLGLDIEKETFCTDDTSVDSFVVQNVDDPEATLLYGYDGPGGKQV